jgi:hypothetical protein
MTASAAVVTASKKYSPLSSLPRTDASTREEQRGDGDGAVSVVEDRHHQGDQAEPGPQPVDRVGAEDSAQPG